MSKIIILDSDEEDIGEAKALVESVPPLAYPTEQPEAPSTGTRRRPRKSVLHTKPNPEVQFETIPAKSEAKPKMSTKKQKNSKAIPQSVLEEPPNAEAIIEEACEEFLSSPEVIDLMHTIAEERVRINYLLSLNSMPKMNFSLYTLYEHLQQQFQQRLNAYKKNAAEVKDMQQHS